MVQVLQPNYKPNFLESLISSAVPSLINEFKDKRERDALEELGISRNIRDPKIREKLLGGYVNQTKNQLPPSDLSTLKEYLPEQIVDVIDSLPTVGMKTAYLNNYLKLQGQNIPLEKILHGQGEKSSVNRGLAPNIPVNMNPTKGLEAVSPQEMFPVKELEPQGSPNIIEGINIAKPAPTAPKSAPAAQNQPETELEWPIQKAPSGYTQKAWAEENRKENTPEFKLQKEANKLQKKERRSLDNLIKISSNLTEDPINRLIQIDDEGNIRPIAAKLGLVSKETQLFVKELAQFASTAKNDYPGRVTDFDLKSHMKKYPSLLNTKEGTQALLRQLEIDNEINQLHSRGYLDTIEHYGESGISNTSAKIIADRKIRDKLEQLEQEYRNIETYNPIFNKVGGPAPEETNSSSTKEKRSLKDIGASHGL